MKYLYALLGLMALIIVISACSKYLEAKFIFRPVKLRQDYKYQFDIPFTEFNIQNNGVSLNALHFKPTGNIKGTIMYFHGNSRNLAHWATHANDFITRDYEIFFYDYRQYGKSNGEITEEKLYKDALNFYDYVSTLSNSNTIILYGRSLGTTFASYTATKRKVDHLILETPFYNMKDVFKLKAPFGIMPLKLAYEMPTNEYIPSVSCPIHIIHGTKDEIVPYASAIKLKKLLKPTDKFITVQGAKHKNLSHYDSYYLFLDSIL